jgi:catechol 2,3-dioxygenase-like lactoylglutathione lyase family enzyme
MQNQASPQLIRSAPYFPVADVERSVDFYQQRLGFQREYAAGSPLQFAICSRDGLAVMFRLVADPHLIVPSERQGGTWDAFFWVRDAAVLHREYQAQAVEIAYGPLIQEAYRMKEFAVRDCDGHVLGFGQALDG